MTQADRPPQERLHALRKVSAHIHEGFEYSSTRLDKEFDERSTAIDEPSSFRAPKPPTLGALSGAHAISELARAHATTPAFPSPLSSPSEPSDHFPSTLARVNRDAIHTSPRWETADSFLPKASFLAMLSVFKKRTAAAADLFTSTSSDLPSKSSKRKKMASESKPIPGNTQWDLITGAFERDLVNPLNSVRSAHQLYGEIFCLTLVTLKMTFCSSQRMVDAMLSHPGTKKINSRFLEELRIGAADGLFTAHEDEPNWHMAHRILIPAFGAMSVRGMYDQMIDISSSMIQRWNAHQGVPIDIPDQLTRLTLDTIALCSFDYRFNSFFKEDMHPFVQDMIDFLSASAVRALKPLSKHINLPAKWKWVDSCKRMQDFADEIIRDRQQNPKDVNDLCRRMLEMEDPKTHQKLPAENVRAQLLTFLVAGHETTSGLLSFCLYYMVKNPETIRKAQKEVDDIGRITRDSLAKMPYIDACLKETLRLQPTAPMFSVTNEEDVEMPGGYVIKGGETVMIDLHSMQNDPKVWGEDADQFRPDRMLDGKFEALPKNSWKPFGHGARSCIGRAFAIQESILAIASILQNFDLELDNPSYELRTKFTLTIKPDDMKMKVRRRQSGPPIMPLASTEKATPISRPGLSSKESDDSGVDVEVEGKPVSILFGSNSGSCEALAKDIAESATNFGLACDVGTLDSALHLPTDRAIVIVTSSYEGKPCDNAKQFAAYLESSPDLKGVKFAIFGAGHSDWVESYMRIPRRFESLMIESGAKPLLPRGEGDVAGDFIGEFEAWKEDLYKALTREQAASGHATPVPGISRSDTPRAINLANIKSLSFEPIMSRSLNYDANHSLSRGIVVTNTELTKSSKLGVAKRHITIRLPKNETYESGDYLSILPTNPKKNVRRILKRFGLSEETKINVRASTGAHLLPVRAFDLLQSTVELATPVQKRMLPMLATRCSEEKEAAFIHSLEGENYNASVLEQRLSTIDLLEKCKSCSITFDEYIKSLQSLHQRQYSISSSPLAQPDLCTLTIDIIKGAHSGNGEEFEGVTSNYLADLKKGDEVSCTVRQSSTFHLPIDAEVPIVCFAAGTGIAPFRGFLQERALQIAAGREVGEVRLYYGCRNATDFLHRKELESWAAASKGKISIRHTFSRAADDDKHKHKHIHELVYEDRAEILRFFREGAKFYTCGSASKLAHSLKSTWSRMVASAADAEERQEYEAFVEATSTNRYAVDIFG